MAKKAPKPKPAPKLTPKQQLARSVLALYTTLQTKGLIPMALDSASQAAVDTLSNLLDATSSDVGTLATAATAAGVALDALVAEIAALSNPSNTPADVQAAIAGLQTKATAIKANLEAATASLQTKVTADAPKA